MVIIFIGELGINSFKNGTYGGGIRVITNSYNGMEDKLDLGKSGISGELGKLNSETKNYSSYLTCESYEYDSCL